ncbi:uncharacterized protein BKA55DRAFT_250667 [Fusarium redolens]|uniref:Uncharacterized protein n=1 Tax=Fusarium redolens TaxID=48865 RepID=A0A9P9HXI4_FUSRE|nr:uncharacterized protein BKA55DRAFT_250667 [Fusarium redolens]KAH7265405.1 hypothetical protein BKA55DRAFT_250667 [Fusarium redolens]
MIELKLCPLRYFAFSITSGFNRECVYRDKEYENINEIFPNDLGATQSDFIKSLVIDMMVYLPKLKEMCILPYGAHFYRGQRMLGAGPIDVGELECLVLLRSRFPQSLELQLILSWGDRHLPQLSVDEGYFGGSEYNSLYNLALLIESELRQSRYLTFSVTMILLMTAFLLDFDTARDGEKLKTFILSGKSIYISLGYFRISYDDLG